MELVTLENTDQNIWVHDKWTCYGTVCTIHNRTDHSMRSFPQDWRADRRIMERICEHGVGHPDPDEFALLAGKDDGTHGCDGCCGLDISKPVEYNPLAVFMDCPQCGSDLKPEHAHYKCNGCGWRDSCCD